MSEKNRHPLSSEISLTVQTKAFAFICLLEIIDICAFGADAYVTSFRLHFWKLLSSALSRTMHHCYAMLGYMLILSPERS